MPKLANAASGGSFVIAGVTAGNVYRPSGGGLSPNMLSRIAAFFASVLAATTALADSYISEYQGSRLYSWDGQYLSKYQGNRLYQWDGEYLSAYQGNRLFERDGKYISQYQGNRILEIDGEYIAKYQGNRLFTWDGEYLSRYQGNRIFEVDGSVPVVILALLAAGYL
jgi:transcriptional regulator of met regulon